jgi:3-oxoadipate enol-lactonase
VTAFVDSAGVRIAWDDQGAGEPVLLVMGHAYPRTMWHRAARALTGGGYRVLTFDNRGAGESDKPPGAYTIAEMAADAVAVLDAAEVERAHVYGVSMGGGTVQEITLAHPDRVRSLILGCTGAMSDDKAGQQRRRPIAEKLMAVLPPRVTARLSVPLTYGPIRDKRKVAEDLALIAANPAPPHGREGQGAAVAAYRSLDRIGTISVPTLVLHGEADRIVPVAWGRELAATIPGARLITYPGAGHNYLTDVTERANADVLTFLRSVDGTP